MHLLRVECSPEDTIKQNIYLSGLKGYSRYHGEAAICIFSAYIHLPLDSLHVGVQVPRR